MRKHIIGQFEFSAKLDAKNKRDFARRAKRADAFQEKIVKAGLEALGINPEDLKKRQEADFALARKSANRRRADLLGRSRQLALQRDRRTMRRQAFRKRFEKTLGNPTASVFLCERASSFFWGVPGYSGSPNPILSSNVECIDDVGKTHPPVGLEHQGH